VKNTFTVVHKAFEFVLGIKVSEVQDTVQPSYIVYTLVITLFQSTLLIAPSLKSYDWSACRMNLGAVTNVQLVNASLAIQLTNAWMCQQKNG